MIQCFLDSDAAGIESANRAISDGIIRHADYNLINVEGKKEAELEDLLDPQKYKDAFYSEFQVDPTIKPPGIKRVKWSDRMERVFRSHGKIWNSKTQAELKLWIANFARDNISDAVIESRMAPVDAFAKSLLTKLNIE